MEVDDDDDAEDVDYDPQMADDDDDVDDICASPTKEWNMFDNDDYDEEPFDFDAFEKMMTMMATSAMKIVTKYDDTSGFVLFWYLHFVK
jgi:hypothetical protein